MLVFYLQKSHKRIFSRLRAVFERQDQVPNESEADSKRKHDSDISFNIIRLVAESFQHGIAAEVLRSRRVEFFTFCILRRNRNRIILRVLIRKFSIAISKIFPLRAVQIF